MAALRDEISAVLETPAREHGLEKLERMLTDGYAEALSLEAETFRLEKRVNVAARQLADGDSAKARELSALTRLLDGRVGDLASLRALLADLRRHADSLRRRAPRR
jgi:hypothetical protein